MNFSRINEDSLRLNFEWVYIQKPILGKSRIKGRSKSKERVGRKGTDVDLANMKLEASPARRRPCGAPIVEEMGEGRG